MAMSPSPQLSPVMGGPQRVDRHHTNSPPPLSKRDKRRGMLADRLEDLTNSFSQSRDKHYREQLQAIQIDMNLITGADAHGNEALKNLPEEIDALVMENIKMTRKTIGPIPQRAGKLYADFAKSVNDAMEERDAALTRHKRDCDVKMSELNATNAYRLRLAQNEQNSLSITLRDRLINSVTSKKNRLSRDKETVEIGDSNALLLHPGQYGITNPASPGGMHGKRPTRHRRDAEEHLTLAEGSKRKRKAADSDESPAPHRQRLDNGNSTPLWFAEKRDMRTQQVDSALYSIDKLFTEKELAMTYNAAALAAHSYILRHPPYADTIDTPPNGKIESSADDATGHTDNYQEDADSPAGGASMERQYSHATRSTRAGAPVHLTGLGIDIIYDITYPGTMEELNTQTPRMPPLVSTVMQRSYTKGDSANQPLSLTFEEATSDLDLIRKARKYNEQNGVGSNLELESGGRALLTEVANPRRYQYMAKSKQRYPDSVRETNGRDEYPVPNLYGGEGMSRGPSERGGAFPMSRVASKHR